METYPQGASAPELSPHDLALLMKICRSVNDSRFSGRRDPREFLGAAWRGWLEAKQKFEPERGLRFSTYAVRIIRGRIMDEIRQEMPYPRHVYRLLRRFHELIDQGISRCDAIEQVLEGTVISTRFTFMAALLDCDSRMPDQDDDELADEMDYLPDQNEYDIAEKVSAKLASEQLELVMQKALSEEERTVIRHLYLEQEQISQVSHTLFLSRNRVTQIARHGLAKMRRYLVRSPHIALESFNRQLLSESYQQVRTGIRQMLFLAILSVAGLMAAQDMAPSSYISGNSPYSAAPCACADEDEDDSDGDPDGGEIHLHHVHRLAASAAQFMVGLQNPTAA